MLYQEIKIWKKHTIDVFDCVYVCLYVMNKLIIVFPLVRFRNWQIVVWKIIDYIIEKSNIRSNLIIIRQSKTTWSGFLAPRGIVLCSMV